GGPYTGQQGSAISFTAVASDPNPAEQAAGFKYSWSYGDGATDSGTSATVSHTYTTAGNYTVTVTITAQDGDQASATAPVTVTPPSSSFILDDSGPGFAMNGAGWSGWSAGYGGELVYNGSTPGAATASWQASGLASGSYLVQATWNGSGNRTSAASYSIY